MKNSTVNISNRWIISSLVLGMFLCFNYGILWGIKATTMIACFTFAYQNLYHDIGEIVYDFFDDSDIDVKQYTFSFILSAVCLLVIFVLSGEYKFRIILGFASLLFLTIIMQIILNKMC